VESQRARKEEAKAIDMQIGDSGSERAAMPYGDGMVWYGMVWQGRVGWREGKERPLPTTCRVVTTAVTCNKVLRVEMEWLEHWLL
jgi:uncharacterized protein YgiM (DUF1202 family)